MTPGRSSALTDLALGVRMSVSGGRSGWARLGLIATGLGIGVAMLLLVASLPTVLDMRAERDAARYPGTEAVEAGDDTLLVKRISSDTAQDLVVGYLLQPEGADAPLPPGVDRTLAPGEALVSPALQRVLESPQGDLLEGRWGDRVVGTIAPDGLVGPQELRVYVGTDQLTGANAQRISAFGRDVRDGGTDATTMLMALVGLTGLLVPVAGFIATAVRFGGEARDRRLAAVRLAGADAATTGRIAAGETLVGAVGGLLVGAGLFAVLRAVVPPLVPPSLTFHGAYLRPAPALAALVVVLVPVAAVLVTRSALKHVIVEPLGVVRRGTVVHRRLWWRIAVPFVGLALMLTPLLSGGAGSFADAEGLVLLGMVLLLVGVALLLPWLLDVTVRRLRPGALSWDLALRRLQHESGTAVRAVSAVVVSVASLVAVHGLLGSETGTPGAQDGKFEAVVYDDLPGSDGSHWASALAGIDGVQSVDTRVMTSAEPVDGGEPIALVVGSCAALADTTSSTACTDGDVMLVAPSHAEVPAPGTTYVLGEPGSGASTWSLPADVATVEPAYPDSAPWLFVTPQALGDAVVVPSGDDYDNAIVTIALDRAAPDVTARLQTAIAQIDPTAMVVINDPEATSSMVTGIRQGLMLGTVALLAVVGANLLVTTAEQLRERRRPLAVLAAFGVRRRVLGLSVLFQVAVPVVVGLALAVVVGSGLAVILQAGADMPVSLDLAGIGVTAGGAAAVILLATAALLPMLGRVTRPAGLQGE